MPRINQIQLRRDTAANWTSVNPVLAAGEVGFETDTRLMKAGDGTTAWTSLAYVPANLANTANLINGKRIIVQTTTPTAPAGGFGVGDVWISYTA
jgi:hypothetical protein